MEGEKSNLICTGTLSQLPASSPENLLAIGGDQQVFLSWNSSEGSPTIFYQIYRYGEYIGQTSLTNYNDVGLQKNTTGKLFTSNYPHPRTGGSRRLE